MTVTCDLIQTLGKERLTRLQEALGPTHLYIPLEPDPEHKIAKQAGLDIMVDLCREFRGMRVWLGNGYANAKRNEEILLAVLAGVSSQDIAKRYGITRRYVRKLVQDDVQPVGGPRMRRRKARVQGYQFEKGEAVNERGFAEGRAGYGGSIESRRETRGDAGAS